MAYGTDFETQIPICFITSFFSFCRNSLFVILLGIALYLLRWQYINPFVMNYPLYTKLLFVSTLNYSLESRKWVEFSCIIHYSSTDNSLQYITPMITSKNSLSFEFNIPNKTKYRFDYTFKTRV